MKCGCFGFVLFVFVRFEHERVVVEAFLCEMSTFGVCIVYYDCIELDCESWIVEVGYELICIKVGTLGGKVVNLVFEYVDCERAVCILGEFVKIVWACVLVVVYEVFV